MTLTKPCPTCNDSSFQTLRRKIYINFIARNSPIREFDLSLSDILELIQDVGKHYTNTNKRGIELGNIEWFHNSRKLEEFKGHMIGMEVVKITGDGGRGTINDVVVANFPDMASMILAVVDFPKIAYNKFRLNDLKPAKAQDTFPLTPGWQD